MSAEIDSNEIKTSDEDTVATLKKLLAGRPCRTLMPGQVITMEFIFDRVNIHLDEKHRCIDVTLG